MNILGRLLHQARPSDEPIQNEIDELNGNHKRALGRAHKALARISGVLDDYEAAEKARRKP